MAEKTEKAAAETSENGSQDGLWRDFAGTFKKSDMFLYGRLMSLPYREDAASVSVTINTTLDSDNGDEFSKRLTSLFDSFTKGRKKLSVSFEKGGNSSIFTENELRRMEDIERRKKEMAESGVVKAAVEMGFEIKGVFAE